MTTGPASPRAYYHPTQFRVGSALARAVEVLSGNFLSFIAISAIATTPILLFELAKAGGAPTASAIWIQVALQFTLSALCEAMILYATFQALRNRPVRPGQSIVRGLQRFAPVVLATLLTSILIGVGTILLVVPGMIALVTLYVTLPACVVERLGAVESMRRSSALTRGYRWPIFGAALLVIVVGAVVGAVATGLTHGAGPAWLEPAVNFVWNTLTQAYQTVLVAIIYHDLRVVKDGFDLENVAGVFD